MSLRQPGVHRGVVPLGTPLIAGPAVLTTLLTIARTQGYLLARLAFGLNLVLVWVALRWASLIVRVIGEAGARAVAKVFELLLAAIGVTLIRRGVEMANQEVSRGQPQAWNCCALPVGLGAVRRWWSDVLLPVMMSSKMNGITPN